MRLHPQTQHVIFTILQAKMQHRSRNFALAPGASALRPGVRWPAAPRSSCRFQAGCGRCTCGTTENPMRDRVSNSHVSGFAHSCVGDSQKHPNLNHEHHAIFISMPSVYFDTSATTYQHHVIFQRINGTEVGRAPQPAQVARVRREVRVKALQEPIGPAGCGMGSVMCPPTHSWRSYCPNRLGGFFFLVYMLHNIYGFRVLGLRVLADSTDAAAPAPQHLWLAAAPVPDTQYHRRNGSQVRHVRSGHHSRFEPCA